jgi:hypothetical protein
MKKTTVYFESEELLNNFKIFAIKNKTNMSKLINGFAKLLVDPQDAKANTSLVGMFKNIIPEDLDIEEEIKKIRQESIDKFKDI